MLNMTAVNSCWEDLPKGATGRVVGTVPVGAGQWRWVIRWDHGNRVDTFSKNNVKTLSKVSD